MAVTPEGKIKKMVKAVLEEFVVPNPEPSIHLVTKGGLQPLYAQVPSLYQFWPVPNGIGASSLDCLVCYYGIFIAIEVKADAKKKPTPRQLLTIQQIKDAGGIALVVYDQEGCDNLRNHLALIRLSHADNSKPQA